MAETAEQQRKWRDSAERITPPAQGATREGDHEEAEHTEAGHLEPQPTTHPA